MIYRPLIILKSGLLLVCGFVLFAALFLGLASQARHVVQQTEQQGDKPTSHLAHHNLGFTATRSQPQLNSTIPSTDHVSVRPLTDIYVDGPPQIVGITTTYATLLFTSSVPVVCSVIYGIDDSFGQVAQDANMNGGAIVEHRPLLTGLLPDTVYQYRVQGNDASGTIYVSEVSTFTTAAESTGPQTENNIAALHDGAEIVAVSSNFGNADNDQAWGADSAIDENPATAWSSNGDGNDAFIEIALTETSVVNAVEVWTRFMANGTARITEFTITVNPQMAASQTFGPFVLPDADRAYRFDVDPTGLVTTIRLDVTNSTGGNTGLVEFKVLASASVTATNTTGTEVFLPLTLP